MADHLETTILAGGCFWGMQDLFRRHPGVVSTRVGYSGGEVESATYRNHGSHAEAIEIVFDPEQTSYRELLEFFFRIHDPTTVDRQGNDVGTSYRSAIFYLDDEQRRIAEEATAEVEASGRWPGKVVTQVSPAGPSGRPSRSIRTIWSAIRTATPAISCGRSGCCRRGRSLAGLSRQVFDELGGSTLPRTVHARRLVLGTIALLVTAGLAVAIGAEARARLPQGVEIAGVSVGGVSAAEAEQLVLAHADQLAAQPLLVVGPERVIRTTGAELGARPRVAAAIAAVGEQRFGRARDLFDGGRIRRVALSWDVDAAPARELAGRLGPVTPPSEAAVTVDAGGVRVREGHSGYEVDSSALRTRLESLPSRVRAPTIRVVPQVTTAEARATAQRVERLTGAMRTILIGSVATVLEPRTLRTLARVEPSGGGLSIAFDAAGLAKLLPASTMPRDAAFRFPGSDVELVPAAQGRILDVASTALRLAETASPRVEAAVTLVQPDVTTAELASLGIRDQVSEFTTYYPPGQPRVVNIQRAAAVIDGTILVPVRRSR